MTGQQSHAETKVYCIIYCKLGSVVIYIAIVCMVTSYENVDLVYGYFSTLYISVATTHIHIPTRADGKLFRLLL